jgi:hypothetical protein
VHDDVTLPALERALQDILKGLESCVVPDEWGTPVILPCISSTAISDKVASTDPSAVPCADPSTAPSTGLCADPCADPSTAPSTGPCADPSNEVDAVLSHITATVQPSDRRSSRFEAQVKTKAKTETGTGIGSEAADGPLMRRLAEDFMYVPTKIHDYRYIMLVPYDCMSTHDGPSVHTDIRSIS